MASNKLRYQQMQATSQKMLATNFDTEKLQATKFYIEQIASNKFVASVAFPKQTATI